MQVAIHLGAHCTDEDRLLRTLLQNQDYLSKQGISIPGPSRYRKVIAQTIEELQGGPADDATRGKIRDSILNDEAAKRVILASENFLSTHRDMFDNGTLYDTANYKTQQLRNLFPDDNVEFFLGMRNPASLVPLTFQHKNQSYGRYKRFISTTNVMDIRWSEVIAAILEYNPDCRLTVWCNEDTPVIWGEVLYKLCGLSGDVELVGNLAIAEQIMSPDGVKRMRAYLEKNPPKSETMRRRIIMTFLEKFVVEDRIEDELDAPGWTEDLVEDLTVLYEDDVAEIAGMSGVRLIEP